MFEQLYIYMEVIQNFMGFDCIHVRENIHECNFGYLKKHENNEAWHPVDIITMYYS